MTIGRRQFLLQGAVAGLVAASRGETWAQARAGGTLTVASSALPPNIEPHMQGLDIWQCPKPLVYEK